MRVIGDFGSDALTMMYSTKCSFCNDVNVPVNTTTNYVNPIILAWFRISKIHFYLYLYFTLSVCISSDIVKYSSLLKYRL